MPASAPQVGHAVGGQWVTAHAAYPGLAHREAPDDCQDASACFSLALEDGSCAVFAAVSDGAGSCPVSGIGSKRAVAASLAMLVRVAQRHGFELTKLARGMGSASRYARASVRSHAVAHGRELADYSCTLLMCVATRTGAVCGQIGDGAIVFKRGDGVPEVAFWPDKGDFANETAFVTDPTYAVDLRVRIIEDSVSGVALFTDGIEPVALDFASKQAFPAFFEPLFERLASATEHERAELSDDLADWLSNERFDAASPDDRTLVLAIALPQVASGGVTGDDESRKAAP